MNLLVRIRMNALQNEPQALKNEGRAIICWKWNISKIICNFMHSLEERIGDLCRIFFQCSHYYYYKWLQTQLEWDERPETNLCLIQKKHTKRPDFEYQINWIWSLCWKKKILLGSASYELIGWPDFVYEISMKWLKIDSLHPCHVSLFFFWQWHFSSN